jgi:hypothetical protein
MLLGNHPNELSIINHTAQYPLCRARHKGVFIRKQEPLKIELAVCHILKPLGLRVSVAPNEAA